MGDVEQVDGVLDAADTPLQLRQTALGVRVIIGGAHGFHVLAGGGAELPAAALLLPQRHIFIGQLLQPLIGLCRGILHSHSSSPFHSSLLVFFWFTPRSYRRPPPAAQRGGYDPDHGLFRVPGVKALPRKKMLHLRNGGTDVPLTGRRRPRHLIIAITPLDARVPGGVTVGG